MFRMFVYGTLKRGEPNHSLLTNKNNGFSEFKGVARTTEKYPLVIGTKYNIPFVLYSPGDGNEILGEVYDVDRTMLVKLDELEGHPDYYTREENEMILKNSDGSEERTTCWIYFLKKFPPYMLSRPTFVDYRSSGDHGLPYVERSERDPGDTALKQIHSLSK